MSLTPEEKFVVDHFKCNYSRVESGRFVVPLPRKSDPPTLGESRTHAVKRFITLENHCSIREESKSSVEQSFKSGHAELPPTQDLK